VKANNISKLDQIYKLQKKNLHLLVVEEMVDSYGNIKKIYYQNPRDAWYLLGASVYELGDYYVALYCFKRAARFNAYDDACMLAIGNCYERLGKPKLSEKWFNIAMKFATDDESKDAAKYNLGNSFFDQKKYDAAIECYKSVATRKDEIGVLARKNLKLFM
jgi:tetratricopeptide (TPR) repeat protein